MYYLSPISALLLLLTQFPVDGSVLETRHVSPDPYGLRPSLVFPFARLVSSISSGNTTVPAARSAALFTPPHTRTWSLARSLHPADLDRRQMPSATSPQDARPTPEPTGDPSPSTTVHVTDGSDFALLLPNTPGELVSDAEADGIAFCTPGSAEGTCTNRMPEGFITAVAVSKADDDSWIQVTGCLDATKFQLDPSDTGGQFDVRYPNGAQCTFGGYGASFIELVEPAKNRFCLRCCSSAGDQANCNSHNDRMGCENAVPGVYDFPELGVNCY